MDRVVGHERGGALQRPDHRHLRAREPDLLFGLAQGGIHQCGVLGVASPAWKGDLARVAAQVRTALGQDDTQLAVLRLVQRHKHGRRHLLVGLWSGMRGRVEQDLAQRRRQPYV